MSRKSKGPIWIVILLLLAGVYWLLSRPAGEHMYAPFEKSALDPELVAIRVATGLPVESTRKVISTHANRAPGVEVNLHSDLPFRNFKIYKIAKKEDLANYKKKSERVASTLGASKKYPWCHVSRKDLVLDCSFIPKAEQADIRRRFLEVFGK